jgi:hypothetical protein
MAARAQLEQMRRALPPGMVPSDDAMAAAQEAQARRSSGDEGGRSGMYL